MKEEVTAGTKEFIFALICAAVLYLLCGLISDVVIACGGYSFVGGVLSVLIFAAYGFFILTRYTSRFTYQVSGGRLRINRMIGKRNKELELSCADIVSTAYGKKPQDFPKRPYNMHKSIASKKRLMFIEYKDTSGARCGVVIEPTAKMRKRIEKERKKKG